MISHSKSNLNINVSLKREEKIPFHFTEALGLWSLIETYLA